MTDKLRFKRQLKQVERDVKYYIENYEMTEEEVYEYLYEIYKIRLSIVENKVNLNRTNKKNNDENPFI